MTGIVRQHSVVGLDLPAQDAIQIARRVLATEGYQSVAVGPTAATFVRDVRPPLGIPLLAMLVNSQEQCTVTAETSRRGTALSLSGVVSTETLRSLDSALRHHGGSHEPVMPDVDDGYNAFPTPGRGAPAQRPITPVTPAPSSGPVPYREPDPLLGAPDPDSGPLFGQDPAPRRGQDSGPLFGQDPAPRRGQDSEPVFGHDPAPRRGQDPAPRRGQEPAPRRGQDPAPRRGQEPSRRRGQDPDPLFGQEPAARGDQDPDPLFGQNPDQRYDQDSDARYDQDSDSRHGQDPAPAYGQAPAPLLGEDPGPLLGDPPPLLGRDPLPPPPPRSQPPVRSAAPDPLPTPLSGGAEALKRPRRGAVQESEDDLTIVRSPQVPEPTPWIESEPPVDRWVIILDDGRTIDVPDFALIGRDPEPTEDDPEAGLVSLIDPEMSVSKTHASFGVDDEGLWFLDRFSTNGTSMQAPGGERIGLEPGIATGVLPGSEVWIGRRHLRVDQIDP